MCVRWISITLWLFRAIQSWDKYTGTKYPSQLMLFASVKWLYIYMYNTITIWYTTMYHETFVVFKHTRAFSWEAFTIKYRTATRIFIVIKNNIEQKNNIFAFSRNPCKCLHLFSSPTHAWTSLKKEIPKAFEQASSLYSQRQWQASKALSVIMKRGPFRWKGVNNRVARVLFIVWFCKERVQLYVISWLSSSLSGTHTHVCAHTHNLVAH